MDIAITVRRVEAVNIMLQRQIEILYIRELRAALYRTCLCQHRHLPVSSLTRNASPLTCDRALRYISPPRSNDNSGRREASCLVDSANASAIRYRRSHLCTQWLSMQIADEMRRAAWRVGENGATAVRLRSRFDEQSGVLLMAVNYTLRSSRV